MNNNTFPSVLNIHQMNKMINITNMVLKLNNSGIFDSLELSETFELIYKDCLFIYRDYTLS